MHYVKFSLLSIGSKICLQSGAVTRTETECYESKRVGCYSEENLFNFLFLCKYNLHSVYSSGTENTIVLFILWNNEAKFRPMGNWREPKF